MVADAKDIHPVLESRLSTERHHRKRVIFADVDVAVVPSGLPIDEHTRAIGTLPPEDGRTFLADSRVVVSAAGSTGIVILHSSLSEDCRNGVGVAEGVRFPVD